MSTYGLKNSGDIVKALAAGAHAVMVGNLFAGTDETPGRVEFIDGRMFKVYRGMASASAAITRKSLDNPEAQKDMKFNRVVAEGVEATVPYKGSAWDILFQLHGGLKSGMSYSNALTVKELQENAEFIKISRAGLVESHPHDVVITKEAPNYSQGK